MKTKGANSFVHVKLSSLTKYLGPECPIVVSKTWLKNLGLLSDEIKELDVVETVETNESREDKIQFTVN